MYNNTKKMLWNCLTNGIIFVVAFLSMLGCISNFDMHSNTIVYNEATYIYLLVFVGYVYLCFNVCKRASKRLEIVSIIISFIITTVFILSYMTSKYFLDNTVPNSLSFIYFVIFKSLSLLWLFYIITKLSYKKFSNINAKENRAKSDIKICWFTDNKKSFVIVAVIILVFNLPFIIDSYPGNVTYDFAVQMQQAIGNYMLTNHHPYMNTLLIAFCLRLGQAITGSYNVGIFLYTLLQIILSCCTFSLIIYYMAKKKIDIRYRIISLLFFIILPIFNFYTVWLTKDILFTLCITLLTIGVIELFSNKEIIKSKKYCSYMIVFLLFSMFCRKNGVYVAAILGVVLLIIYRKNWRRLLVIFLIPIAIFKIIDGPVREVINIPDSSSVEMYSILAQQMARIYKYEQDSLEPEQKQKIELYISDENISDIYDPNLSDPIKAKLNEEVINSDKIGFLKFGVELAIKYPIRTVESFLCTTYRFYYLDNEVARGLGHYKEQSAYVIENMIPAEMNVKSYINDIEVISKLDNIVYKNNVPILNVVCGSGIYICIYILCIGYLVYTKKYKYIVAFLPVFILMITQLAGPVVDQRYSYCVFTCFTILLGTTLYISQGSESSNAYLLDK